MSGPVAAALSVILVLGGAVSAAHPEPARTVLLNGILHVTWKRTACPVGTPGHESCLLEVGRGAMTGLGKSTERYILVLSKRDTRCPQVRFNVALTLTGKGTIDATATSVRCVKLRADVTTVAFTIVGGTDAFTSASGGGSISESRPGVGAQTDTWRGRVALSRK